MSSKSRYERAHRALKVVPEKDTRTWAYHHTCPDGQIFPHADAVPEGWVDSPAKTGKKRGRPKKDEEPIDPVKEAIAGLTEQVNALNVIVASLQDSKEEEQTEGDADKDLGVQEGFQDTGSDESNTSEESQSLAG